MSLSNGETYFNNFVQTGYEEISEWTPRFYRDIMEADVNMRFAGRLDDLMAQSLEEWCKNQFAAGLNMGIAGIPWWTTDIGGFMTDDYKDPDFVELLIRWYQFGVFCPVFRMHGNRGPDWDIPALDDRDFGGGYLYTGHPNEIWSYGDECFNIMKKYLGVRESLKDYIEGLMKQASETGAPLIRTMFYEFPNDKKCWELPEQFMFGPDYLVAPILQLGTRERTLYLPAGKWQSLSDNTV